MNLEDAALREKRNKAETQAKRSQKVLKEEAFAAFIKRSFETIK